MKNQGKNIEFWGGGPSIFTQKASISTQNGVKTEKMPYLHRKTTFFPKMVLKFAIFKNS